IAERAITKLVLAGKGITAHLNGTLTDVLVSMERSGVDISVILPIATKPTQVEGITNWSKTIQSERIISFGSIHPEYNGWKDEIKRMLDNGIRGVKFHPDYQDFFVNDEKMFPIYEGLFDAGMIVVFHAGLDI